MDRFRSTQGGTGEEKILALRQEGTVREYRLQIELLAVPLTKILMRYWRVIL